MLKPHIIAANVFLAIIVSTSAFLFPDNRMLEEDQPLPATVIPTSYWVALKPDIKTGTFSGNVEINIKCKEATNVIVLHAHESLHINTNFIMLTPERVSLSKMIDTVEQAMFSNSTHANIANIRRNTTSDELIITLVDQMQVGESYLLYIEFSGKMILQQDYQSCGLLNGIYDAASNSSFVMTKMSIKCARRVFPCFDEPSFKASFQISVARPKNMTAISVMPVEFSETIEGGDWMWDHFEPSPPISPLSINIFISKLNNSRKVNIATKYGKYSVQYHYSVYFNKTSYDPTNMFSQAIQFMEDYLGIPFPVPKLDIVVLPTVIYSDINTLGTIIQYDYMLNHSALYALPSLIDQWVLHTVTPAGWNNLNISNILGMFLAKASFVNLTNNPVWYAMGTSEMYDYLSEPLLLEYYRKEMSIHGMIQGDWFLQMLRTSLSENTVKNGLSNLFIHNMYGTCNESMLWDSVSKQAWTDGNLQKDMSVQTLANSWVHKPMFPLLTINRNYEDNSASLEQHVFMRSNVGLEWVNNRYYRPHEHNWTQEEKEMKWWIPISYLTPHSTKHSSILPSYWMKEEGHLHITNLPDNNDFIIVNPTDSGMFLVNYDQQNWNLITQTLINDKNKLPALTRKKVLLDASILANNGNLTYVTFLNMSLFLFNEKEPAVWNPFVSAMLKSIERIFLWSPVEQKLHQYLRKLVTPFYDTLKASKDKEQSAEDIANEMMEFEIKTLMLKIGYQPYINETHKRMNNKLPTYPFEDSQSHLIIFCPKLIKSKDIDLAYAAKIDSYPRYLNYGYDVFWQASLSRCPGYSDFISKLLNITLNETIIYGDNDWQVISNLVLANPTAHKISLSFLLKNFDILRKRLRTDHMKEFMTAVLSRIRSEEGLQMLLNFYLQHEHDPGHISEYITPYIKDAYKRLEWDKQHLSGISHWFDNILPNFVQL